MSDSHGPGAYVVAGKLFFKLLDGSTVSCDCIGGCYARQIAELFAQLNAEASEAKFNNVAQGATDEQINFHVGKGILTKIDLSAIDPRACLSGSVVKIAVPEKEAD